MSISFDFPASVEDLLRRELADLDVVAKEAVLAALDRQGRITHHQLGLSLGLERHETDGLLKRHKVVEDLPRAEELAEEIATLRRLIDERYGSRVARDLGLTTVGTVGILAAAAGKGLVSLRRSFDALRSTTFRGPDGLMDELLRMDESRR
ncbi:MAG: hypothetical protein ACKO9B_05160 [Planctomycetota bacterium]